MVVVDESVTNFHGRDKVEKYVLTMMKMVGVLKWFIYVFACEFPTV